MKILEIIPVVKGLNKELLTYFSKNDAPLGSVVTAKIRNRNVAGIVLSSRDAKDEKSEIKNLPFALKKIENIEPPKIWDNRLISTARKISDFYATSTGSILSTITPSKILDSIDELSDIEFANNKQDRAGEVLIIQSPDEDRYSHYKSLIRESFAKKQSVYLLVPTIEDANRALRELEKGIEEYTFVLDGTLTGKELLFRWMKVLSEEHSVLIIGTGSYLSIPKNDIGTLIIERENSRSYKTNNRPFIDMRHVAQMIAECRGARLVLGDELLRTETLYRYKQGEVFELAPIKWRTLSTVTTKIADMKNQSNDFKIISPELASLLEKNKTNSEHLFIYASRRGLAPQVLCKDCGTVVLCSRCSVPVVLHSGDNKSKNYFLCHKCGERRPAHEKCTNCEGWGLISLGLGIETIEKELKKFYPQSLIYRIDFDSVKTHKRAKAIGDSFYDTPGAVLIGTEMALLYMNKPFENSAISSIDQMFSIPDFRINEKIMSTMVKIRNLTTKRFLLQTRRTDQKIFDLALKGNLIDFYRNEIEQRENYGYPPFTILIKISFQGKKDAVLSEMTYLKKYLEEYKVSLFPAFIETVRNEFIMHALIKYDKRDWPDKKLVSKLRSLPPSYTVKIDPDSLL